MDQKTRKEGSDGKDVEQYKQAIIVKEGGESINGVSGVS